MATGIVVGNVSVLNKVQSFLNDPQYRETIENSATYNTRLCIERRLRMPFLDSQTGVAQNHSNLFMAARHRIPGLVEGQVYTYPSKRWRKKRRQYLLNFMQPRRKEADPEVDLHTISTVENPAAVNEDSKDSISKDEPPKFPPQEPWFYEEFEVPDAGEFDDPDPDSDYDYEETYSKRKKKRGGKVTRGGGRGRKKTPAFDPTTDAEKPFSCELCGARYKTRPGLTYHYTHSHKDRDDDEEESNTASPKPVRESSSNSDGMAGSKKFQDSYLTFLKLPGAGGGNRRGGGSRQGPPVAPAVASTSTPMPPIPVPVMEEIAVEKKKIDPEEKERAQPSPYCDFCLGDANENKKTGQSEELVSCSDCGRSGHPTCLQFTANMIISVRKYRWQCIECKCCSICGTSDNDDQLLFCDDCDRGYHMYCLSPPLSSPPEGSWSCRLCISEFHKK